MKDNLYQAHGPKRSPLENNYLVIYQNRNLLCLFAIIDKIYIR